MRGSLPRGALRDLRDGARWFVRLRRSPLSIATLEAFRRWRARPEAQRAYAVVDGLWRDAGALRHDPEIAAAMRRAAEGVPARPRVSTVPALGLGLAGVAALGLALVLAGAPMRISSPVGARRDVVLADGSRVVLDTDTLIAVTLAPRRRHVRLLKGQALFVVAHDVRRPFVVESAGATVTALGTRFDVRRDGGQVQVALVEGRVRVVRRGRAWTLAAGETLQLASGSPARVSRTPPALGWTRGRLVFDAVPLGVATAEVNRYRLRPIRLGVGVDAGTPASGVFDAADPHSFIAAACRLQSLQAVEDADGVLLRPRSPEAPENIVAPTPGKGRPPGVYPPDFPHPET